MSTWLTLAVVAAFMAVEARRANSQERQQRARGGIEPPGDVYPFMQVAYPASFLLMIAEGLWRGAPSSQWMLAGALMLAAAKALKWWAILSLGRCWTFRVIVVPGDRLVQGGPYRYLSHPNYVAVIGELVAVAMLTGARVTGPIVVLVFGLLIAARVAVERRALGAILPPS